MIEFMLSKGKRKWKKETKFEWKNIKLVIAEKLSVEQYIIKIIDADTREDEYMECKSSWILVDKTTQDK